MRKRTPKQPSTLRTFRVGYYLEQGFTINVPAQSAVDAERIIRKRLRDETDVIIGSTRVHYDDGISCTSEVRS